MVLYMIIQDLIGITELLDKVAEWLSTNILTLRIANFCFVGTSTPFLQGLYLLPIWGGTGFPPGTQIFKSSGSIGYERVA